MRLINAIVNLERLRDCNVLSDSFVFSLSVAITTLREQVNVEELKQSEL